MWNSWERNFGRWGMSGRRELDALLKLFGPTDNGILIDNLAKQAYRDLNGDLVSADGQAAPLIMDRSKGMKLGDELVSNGGFDSDTGWTKGTGWAVADGKATKTPGSSAYLYQSSTIVSGALFCFKYTVSGRTAGNVSTRLENAITGTLTSTNGTFTDYILSNSANPRIILSADSSFDGSVDNVSVREVPGNHALQATAASEATYDTDTAVPNLTLDGGDYYNTGLIPSSEMTLAVCMKSTNPNLQAVIGSVLSSTARLVLFTDATGKFCAQWGSQIQTTILGTSENLNTDAVGVLRVSSSAVDLAVNGVSEYSGAAGESGDNTIPLYIGAYNNGGSAAAFKMIGSLYRAFAINRYVSDAEVQIITKGLAAGVVTL